MMSFALRALPLFLLGCSTSFVGAGRSGELAPIGDGNTGIVVQQATVLLDEAPGLIDLEVGTDQIIAHMDGTPLSVEVGSVVVGRWAGGYLREVTEVIEQGDRIVLRTVRADLSAAILHGRYAASAEIAERAATTWDIGGRVLYDGDVWSNHDGDMVHVNAFIAEGAEVTIDPQFDFDIELFNGNWIDAGFAASVDLDYNADFVVSANGAYDTDLQGTLLTRDIDFDFNLGPVPVTGRATVTIVAGMRGDFRAGGTTTLHTEASAHAELGAGYNDDGWYFNRDGSVDGDIGFTDNDLTHSLQTRAWLRAEITVSLYDAAGAELTVEPWLEVNSCLPAGVDIDAGVRGDHRYYFDAFNWYDFDSGTNNYAMGPYNVWEYQCENGF